ncbi:NAD-binding protein [Halopiger thermotolerans]
MTTDKTVMIAGGGRVGAETAEMLSNRGHEILIIERDPERCKWLSNEYTASVFEGNAARPDVLERSGLADCDVFAALTGDEGTNLAACMMAQRLTQELHTVARTESEADEQYEPFVDAVVSPEISGARSAANAIISSNVRTLVDTLGAIDIHEIRVNEDAPVAGRQLEDVRFPDGSLVISTAEGDAVAGPSTVFEPGERYVVATQAEVVDEVLNLLRG